MKIYQKSNSAKTYNYRKLLPSKIYRGGNMMDLIPFFGMIWLLFEKAEWVFFLSSFGVITGILILKPVLEEDPVMNSWKLSCFFTSLSMMTLQYGFFLVSPIL